jgi:hypothetical protein
MEKRGKMSRRDKILQHGRKSGVKEMGQNVSEGIFVTIQVKRGGRFVTATLRPPLRRDGRKIPGHSD